MGSETKKTAAPSTSNDTDSERDREALIRECEHALDELMNDPDAKDDFATYEKKLLELVHEIARRKLQKKLQTMADGFAERLAIDQSNDCHGLHEDTVFRFRRHCLGTIRQNCRRGPKCP